MLHHSVEASFLTYTFGVTLINSVKSRTATNAITEGNIITLSKHFKPKNNMVDFISKLSIGYPILDAKIIQS